MERRLAAILISDIVGFTKLMEADAEGTVAAWADARDSVIEPKIASFDGRLVKFLGDGFLVEFGTVQKALECAIDIQTDLKTHPLVFRMAIHLGDIMDDGKDIYGEGINIAARLEEIAESGGICISGDVYNQVHNRILVDYEDIGRKAVKNVTDPVQVYAVKFGTQTITGPEKPNTSSVDKPSIAVLPFDNMSGDPEQEYFADGMTEDIITELSHLRWLNVIARNSSFSYKGQSPDIRQVASELGVRYVLEGSVRRSGNRVRINAQLLEGSSAAHLWAEKYDRDLIDVFDLQDEITSSVLGAIEPSLRMAEIDKAKRKHPSSLDAYDLYLKALSHLYAFNPEDNYEALELFHRAIDLEPEYAEAIACAAWGYEQRFTRGWELFSENDLKMGAMLARRAIETKTEDPVSLVLSGFVLIISQMDVEFGILTTKRALRNNPNIGFVFMIGGTALLYAGENNASAVNFLEAALKTSPRDPMAFGIYCNLGAAYMEIGDLEKAEDLCQKSVEIFPSWDTSIQTLIAILVEKNKIEEAKIYTRMLLKIDQKASVKSFTENFRISNNSLKSRMVLGLEKAGIPSE